MPPLAALSLTSSEDGLGKSEHFCDSVKSLSINLIQSIALRIAKPCQGLA